MRDHHLVAVHDQLGDLLARPLHGPLLGHRVGSALAGDRVAAEGHDQPLCALRTHKQQAIRSQARSSSHIIYMPEAYISRVANRLGAVALTLSDDIREATEMATGMAGGLPAALVSLQEWADGRSVDVLAEAMRVSHSRAVRVVDRLEAAGLARRESDPADGRRALVWLEPAGRELAERALDARSRVLLLAVAGLDAADVRDLERLLGALLDATTVDVRAAMATCRLCDAHACGHYDGTLPGDPGRRSAESARRDPRSRPGAPRVAAVFALAAVAPLFFSAGGDVLHNMVLAAAYVVMALGLNIIVGFAGLLDLGYVAFFAIGAYTAAYFGSGFWANADVARSSPATPWRTPGIHVNFLLILVLAVAATAIAGALIGVPTLRLRGDYIAIVTLAFGEIIGQIVVQRPRASSSSAARSPPGPIGIGPIDRIELPLIGRFGALDLRPWYWFALALVALALVVNVNLRDSRIGRAWIAMRDDESAAACAGIPIVRTKLLAYGTGAAFGGISGAFFASYLGVVNAAQFEFSFSIFIFAMVVLGGLGSITGVVVGAIVLSVVNNYLLPDVLFDLPGKVGLDVRPVGDQLRHLRRDPRRGDAAPAAGARAGQATVERTATAESVAGSTRPAAPLRGNG